MSVMREGIKINDDGSISVTFASGSTIDSPTFTGVAKGVPTILSKSSIPFIGASTGTMANNGAVTLGTALGRVYSKGCYMYFPANAIAAGVAAGWYWTVMSSATVGTVFNSTYVTGTPLAGAQTAFSTTGPGAYTGDLTAQGVTIAVPAAMGVNGKLLITAHVSNNNSAGTKTFTLILGSTTFLSNAPTTSIGTVFECEIANAGVAGAQDSWSRAMNKDTQWAMVCDTVGTENTASGLNLTLKMQRNTATDNATIEGYHILLLSDGT